MEVVVCKSPRHTLYYIYGINSTSGWKSPYTYPVPNLIKLVVLVHITPQAIAISLLNFTLLKFLTLSIDCTGPTINTHPLLYSNPTYLAILPYTNLSPFPTRPLTTTKPESRSSRKHPLCLRTCLGLPVMTSSLVDCLSRAIYFNPWARRIWTPRLPFKPPLVRPLHRPSNFEIPLSLLNLCKVYARSIAAKVQSSSSVP